MKYRMLLVAIIAGFAEVLAACSYEKNSTLVPTAESMITGSLTSTPSAPPAPPTPSPAADGASNGASISPLPSAVYTGPDSKKSEVKLNHIRFQVNSEWKVNAGADSVSFSVGGHNVAVIDALAYSENIEELLPSRVDVMEKKELKELPFSATEVITKGEAEPGTPTVHIYLFLKEEKVVYDVRSASAGTKEETLIDIVESAKTT